MQTEQYQIKIILTDKYRIFRQGLKVALDKNKDIQILTETENAKELLDKLEYLTPDIVIMDLRMEVMDGLTALPILKQKYPGIKIIIVTMYDDAQMICKVIEMGANAYLLKSTEPEEIYKAIIYCMKNSLYLNDIVKDAILKSKSQNISIESNGYNKRELQILQLLVSGKNIEEISKEVELSVRTVEAIIHRMKEKAGVQSLESLLKYAKEKGVLSVDDVILETVVVKPEPNSKIEAKIKSKWNGVAGYVALVAVLLGCFFLGKLCFLYPQLFVFVSVASFILGYLIYKTKMKERSFYLLFFVIVSLFALLLPLGNRNKYHAYTINMFAGGKITEKEVFVEGNDETSVDHYEIQYSFLPLNKSVNNYKDIFIWVCVCISLFSVYKNWQFFAKAEQLEKEEKILKKRNIV